VPYEPRMPEERVRRLRAWHEDAYERDRREETLTVSAHGLTFVVPPDVYPPNPHGLAELVRAEVRDTDRVLDLGTGSGVNAIVAAATAREVVAVDVSAPAAGCARANAERNGVRLDVRVSDLFEAVDGRFDLIVFDPPYRWFRPRDLRERATADEGYATLTAFFEQVRDHLAPRGRVLLSFGTTGDIDYLHELIDGAGLAVEELRRVELVRDGFAVEYFAFRLAWPG
jgi:release factor glutamine methyltransferase